MNRLSALGSMIIALLCLTLAIPPGDLLAQQQRSADAAVAGVAID
jgi:hypothetical protein